MNQLEFNRNIALKWIEAFNEHDIEKLLSLYSDDAVHFSPKLKVKRPETEGRVTGKAAMRSWWQDAFETLPTLHYRLTNLVIDEKHLLMEYERYVEGEPLLQIAEILAFRKNLIIRSRVYHG